MADGIIQVPPDSTGKKVDAASMDVGANTVMRQRMVIGDNSATAQFATVTGGALLVTGTVSLGASTANIGTINNISATVVVAGIVSLGAGTALIGAVSLAAGTANIGFINNISATVTVAGTVSLGAGTANIGSINNISATVIVAGEIANGASLSTTNKPILMGGNTSAGGAGGLMATLLVDTSGRIILGASTNNIGAVSNAAGTALMGAVSLAAGTANIGFINNISATVVISGTVSLGAGTANIGTINNVSATVVVAGVVSLAAGTANIGFINNISATVVTGLSYVIEKTTNSQVQVGDSLNAAVRVNVVAGSAGSPSNVDNTTYSTGVTNVVPSGFIFFSASATAMLDGRVGAGRMTEFRAQHVNLRHSDGTEIDLSSTPSVVLVTGTSNIGFLNNISATVVVAGTVSLGAGTANIGSINNISATVLIAGVVSLAAGTANIGFLNGISATVVTGLSYVIEKTTNSQVQVGDSLNAAIRVNVVAGSSGGPSNTDNTTYSTGVTTVAGAGFIHFSASAVAMTDGRIGAARITSQRGVHVNLRTDTGTAMDDVTNNALRVNVVAGGAAGGTSLADGSPFTPQTTAFTPIGGEVDDVAPGVLAEGSAGAVRVTPNRAFHVNLRDSAGAELGTVASPLSVKVERQSATVNVALVAGTANIGFLNNISATVLVAGTISLGAGAANIGIINNISATVIVAGVVSLGAGTANIGSINNISATVVVSGTVSLGASTAVIGTLNNISATVVVAGEIANGASLSTTNKPVLMGGNTSAGGAGGLMVTLLLDTSGRPILGAGTNNIGAVSLAAGTANIGFINNISATVLVAGVVSLGAGAANIGFINNISATVIVAGVVSIGAGTNLMGAVSLAAGTANIGFINNISATVIVAGVVSIGAGTNLMGAVSLAAGTANIGFINNISATVTTVVNGFTPAIMSASHGPKCVTASTSANVTLIASPGAGLFVYITQIACSNAGAVGSRHRIGTSASIATIVMFCASAGGGFVMNFDPPWKLSASEAALCSVKPNTSKGLFNVNFFVAA